MIHPNQDKDRATVSEKTVEVSSQNYMYILIDRLGFHRAGHISCIMYKL